MMRRLRITALAFFALLTMVAAPLASAQETVPYPEPQRTITTTGVGIVTAEPDMARFSVGIEARNESLKPAQDEVTDESSAITAMLKEAGIEDKDIVTSSYQVTPENKYDRNGNFVRVENYVVRMSITITVRDITIVGTLLDQAVTLGADYVSSITFTVANPEPYIREARQAAIYDAKTKAEDYAAGSDSSLTGLFSLYESSSPQPAARDGGLDKEGDMVMAEAAPSEANPVEISAGSTTFVVQVETTWTIQPNVNGNDGLQPDATPAN